MLQRKTIIARLIQLCWLNLTFTNTLFFSYLGLGFDKELCNTPVSAKVESKMASFGCLENILKLVGKPGYSLGQSSLGPRQL